MSILLYAETSNGLFKKQTFEAATYAVKLAEILNTDILALTIGKVDSLEALSEYGIANIKSAATDLTSFDTAVYASIINQVANQENSDILVCHHSSQAKNFTSYLSVKWDADLITEANDLPESTSPFIVRKNVFAGKAKAFLQLNSERKIISIAGNSLPLESKPVEANVTNISVDIPQSRTTVLKVDKVEGTVPLPEAELVVSGGRGFKGPENWHLLLDLAEALGATTACSRPVADSDWRPHHEHVGQTGVTIRPNLYIAVGISGAIQHLGGVNNSKIIVVINNDPEAPFFKAANYGICGDLFQVLPKLTEEIKRFKASS